MTRQPVAKLLLFGAPGDLAQRMTGAVVTQLGRRAKYGLIGTDRGDTMIFHLGMSGRWRIDPAETLTHDHLIVETGAGRRLALNDPQDTSLLFGVIEDLTYRTRLLSLEANRRLGDSFTIGIEARFFTNVDRRDTLDGVRDDDVIQMVFDMLL